MAFVVRQSYLHILMLICFFKLAVTDSTVISPKEQVLVDRLRLLVSNMLTMEYMKVDTYLLKWLKAKNFNVDAANEAMVKAFEWRKEANADNIPFEDLSKINKDYFVGSHVRDNLGRPVILVPVGDWNVRRKALAGRVSEVVRRMDYAEEVAAQLAYNLTGESTSMIIADAKGFTLSQHACVRCVPFYLNFVRHHELYYPYNFYKMIGINVPTLFQPILQLMYSLMTPYTRQVFRVYGYDREEFGKDILETVAPENLPIRYGGTKKPNIGGQKMKVKA